MRRSVEVITAHALKKYMYRTGRSLEIIESLNEVKTILNSDIPSWYSNYDTVREFGFNITVHKKGDVYAIWYDDLSRQKLCAIISHDNHAITVLPQAIYDVPRRRQREWYTVKVKQARGSKSRSRRP